MSDKAPYRYCLPAVSLSAPAFPDRTEHRADIIEAHVCTDTACGRTGSRSARRCQSSSHARSLERNIGRVGLGPALELRLRSLCIARAAGCFRRRILRAIRASQQTIRRDFSARREWFRIAGIDPRPTQVSHLCQAHSGRGGLRIHCRDRRAAPAGSDEGCVARCLKWTAQWSRLCAVWRRMLCSSL